MLQRKQIQIVADKLAGRDPGIDPDSLDEPWRRVYRQLDPWDIEEYGPKMALWYALPDNEDAPALRRVLLHAMKPDEECRTLLELAAELEPVRWLWPFWIPRGMLSILGAAPGMGKSLLALDLARRILAREPFPDGSPSVNSDSRVVYVDAEAVPALQNARAESWGVDRDRLWMMLPRKELGMMDFGSSVDQDRLVDACCRVEPDLVIVDSLGSIHVKGENNVEDVRAVLGFLGSVAREFGAGLLLVHHLRKRGKGFQGPTALGLDEFRGSTHIIAVARSVLGLTIVQAGPEPDRNGPRRLEVVKTNLCRYPEPLGVVLEEPEDAPGDPAAGDVHSGVPTIRYTPPPKPYRAMTKADQCAAWLADYLEEAAEPMRPADVIRAADEAGYTRGVVYRARTQLRGVVADTKGKHHPENRWQLSGDGG